MKTMRTEIGGSGAGGGRAAVIAERELGVGRDPVTSPSRRTQRALAAYEERNRRELMEALVRAAGLVALVMLGAIALAIALAGCTTIPAAAVDQLRVEVSAGRGHLKDWATLSDDDKKHALWNQIRAQKRALNASAGDPMEEFEVSPWDKSATSDAITLPVGAGK